MTAIKKEIPSTITLKECNTENQVVVRADLGKKQIIVLNTYIQPDNNKYSNIRKYIDTIKYIERRYTDLALIGYTDLNYDLIKNKDKPNDWIGEELQKSKIIVHINQTEYKYTRKLNFQNGNVRESYIDYIITENMNVVEFKIKGKIGTSDHMRLEMTAEVEGQIRTRYNKLFNTGMIKSYNSKYVEILENSENTNGEELCEAVAV